MLRDIAVGTTHSVVPTACVQALARSPRSPEKGEMFEIDQANVQAVIGATVLIALATPLMHGATVPLAYPIIQSDTRVASVPWP